MATDNGPRQTTLAVLIDADNAQPSVARTLIAEVAKYGVANVKRIYGDWTRPQLGGWKAVLLEHSIQPVQQFGYTSGKNATDSAMIIDAMDLLYSRKFDGFCLVSSDSDFTRLAARIREEGLSVYGFGEKKTPKAFVSACSKFIYTEVLLNDDSSKSPDRKARETVQHDNVLISLLRGAAEAAADDTGWAQLGTVGSTIAKQSPDFDPRNHGYRRLSDLVVALGIFEISERPIAGGQSKAMYVRVPVSAGPALAVAAQQPTGHSSPTPRSGGRRRRHSRARSTAHPQTPAAADPSGEEAPS